MNDYTTTTTELTETAPQWSDDGMDGYHKGCTIHITATARWTVGPAPIRYRIEVDNPDKGYRDYVDGLTEAQAKAAHYADVLAYYRK